jgi:hypothetical protein
VLTLVVACNATTPTPTFVAPMPDTPDTPTFSFAPGLTDPPTTPTFTSSLPPTQTPTPTALQTPMPTPSPSSTPIGVPPYMLANCTPKIPAGWSIARYWDEKALAMIRVSPPAPTVHARNLFSLSAVMWDAWAAYDPVADGYFYDGKVSTDDVARARDIAISFAAYRLLRYRYFTVGNLDPASQGLELQMEDICLRPEYDDIGLTSPAQLGNLIGVRAIAEGKNDGSLEADGYVDYSFEPVNDPMAPFKSGTVMNDPNKWQPLRFPRGQAQGQGGRPAPDIQTFVGAQWGFVTPFALPVTDDGVPIDPGPPPALGGDPTLDEEYKQAAIDVLRYSSTLTTADGVTEDISPAALGNNDLATNDGHGRPENPTTGEPYAPDVVLRADYERAVAEYWADGPASETPPGHWNLIANAVADSPGFQFRFAGGARITDRLEWDVKMYFALNGALHDSAIAAWGLKRDYDSVRPISMIRYMCGLGQSSDENLRHYNPEGIPLVPGLVELITPESAAPGERHAALADHIGEIAVYSWRGFPKDPTTETSGVGWILGVNWVPYQRAGFVTPAFPGYVSGHSTYSRAAAEVLAAMTGSEFFPGGLFTVRRLKGSLRHEVGPTTPVTFEWASYFDAADSAGISRLYMGIHIPEDDFTGRRIGSEIGKSAWALAERYFDGSVTTQRS